jgi:4,5-dihydroxyphthalate decarboxylase
VCYSTFNKIFSGEQVATMLKLKLTLACWDYDRTRPLIDGRVQAEGIDLDIKVLRPRETFPRMLEDKEFEVSELSLASYTGGSAVRND